jgi:hypothetical protein
LALFVAGCGGDTASGPNPPVTSGGPVYHYKFLAEHIHFLGTSGRYIAWMKFEGDTSYSLRVPLLAFFYGYPDSMKFEGDVTLPHSIDSLRTILVSAEPDTSAIRPSSPLVSGNWSGSPAFLSASATVPGVAQSHATVTFATASSDTLRSKHEFYLMTLASGEPRPSAIDLPVSPKGWRYALWVTDSAYEPKHLFYYGSFSDPTRSDDDTTAGDLPYPGGYRPPSLEDPGSQILLTLEPTWRLAARPPAPFPVNIFHVNLKRFIHDNEALTMTNVTETGLPRGYFSLVKK